MSRQEKTLLGRIIAAVVLFAAALLIGAEGPVRLLMFLLPYFVVGWDVLWRALRNILRGQVFDENFLMTAATIGAFCLHEYPEGVTVMLFYQVGELFQSYAVSRSRRSIADLMDIRPDSANLLRDGTVVRVSPEEVEVGDQIVINPGERVPLDGTILDGHSFLDVSALTGESVPREVQPGEAVVSGGINQSGRLTVQVDCTYGQSTVAKILELVETAQDKKSRSENFITRFSRYYTPAVVIAAVLLGLIPPLVTGQPFADWIHRALIFLVISCPCALVISVPLSFFGGIGGASRSGILVKGANYLEALSRAEIVVFDKTGTLTKGNFVVTDIKPSSGTPAGLLELAAYAENASGHPIALSIRQAFGAPVDPARIGEIQELAGFGVRAIVDGREILAGNSRLMERFSVPYSQAPAHGTVVHIAADGVYAGYLRIEDQLKEDAAQAVTDLAQVGVRKTVMLTGDSDAAGRAVAEQLKLDEVYTELLPVDKVTQVERLIDETSARGQLVFAGDGINDAPVLARADIGIAMGGLGSDAAIEAADVVIMTDQPSRIAVAVRIAKKTLRIVRQNIVFALGVKAVVLLLGALGLASMWAAVFADVGVSVLAILNAMRVLRGVSSGK